MSDFPAWRFRADGKSVIVHSQEEADCLSDAWTTTVPDGWGSVTAPHFPNVALVDDFDPASAIVEEVAKRRGRPPKKAE